MRRLILSLMLVLALLASCFAIAETAPELAFPQTLLPSNEDRVIWRTGGRTRALLRELEVAYVEHDQSLLTAGKSAKWTVHATGGDGNYQYKFALYYRRGDSGSMTQVETQKKSSRNSFETVVEKPGQYMLVLQLYDTSGASLEYQCKVNECCAAEDYGNPNTVAGKVELLAKQCTEEAGSSDYARALWLHDWLIYNANYDYTFSYYYPDGVLLKGSGVCQSYALAYQILLDKVGIESVYIRGTANGGSHGWNLVKIGGSWYHVDCTWDDPGTGGSEGHSYFCLTDEQMAADHEWDSVWEYMPECDSEEYNYNKRMSTPVVRSEADLRALLAEMARGRIPYMAYVSEIDGDYDLWNIWYDVVDELGVHYSGGSHVKYGNNGYVAVDFGGGYPNVPQAASLSIDEAQLLLDVGEQYKPLTFCGPDRVFRSTESGRTEWIAVKQEDYKLEWTSSNPAVAAVEDGRILACSPGIATITARCDSAEDSLQVLVVRENAGLTALFRASMKSIEEEAFLNDASLTRIIFEEGCTLSIGPRAFAGCTGVDLVYIPAGMTEIADDAFDGCDAIMLCAENSAAHRYALEHGMPVFLMDHYML